MISRQSAGCKLSALLLSFLLIAGYMFYPTVTPRLHFSSDLTAAEPEAVNLTVTHEAVSVNKIVSESNDTKSVKGTGYFTAMGYWEQQTQALLNFYQLQCIANVFGMQTVEPFLIGKKDFGLVPPAVNAMRVSDLYDFDIWNSRLKTLKNYQPVSNWEDMKTNAPRNVILHCICYPVRGIAPGSNLSSCPVDCYKPFDSAMNLLSEFGFKVVRKSRSDFTHDSKKRFSIENFRKDIFGKYDPSDVTVIIDIFKGMNDDPTTVRLPLTPICTREDRVLPPNLAYPSKIILNDAIKYSDGKKYLSILGRFAKLRSHKRVYNYDDCVASVKNIQHDLLIKRGLSDVYLAMDVGKYGDHGGKKSVLKSLQVQGEAFLQVIYGKGKRTFNEWEDMLSNISSHNNPFYIANLQRVIAAKGDCLVMLGGGSFQAQTQEWYQVFHPEEATRCVFNVCAPIE